MIGGKKNYDAYNNGGMWLMSGKQFITTIHQDIGRHKKYVLFADMTIEGGGSINLGLCPT